MTAKLSDWLARLEQLHPTAIELGLTRVALVRDALNLCPEFPVILVGGTNGKGSTCAYLEAILLAAGYKTGLYTSPHLLRYNERVRIAGLEASDAELVAAFEVIDRARGDTSLTYFEFGTLGAMLQFQAARVDVAILEVGLGGRLDAVNVFDADAAICADPSPPATLLTHACAIGAALRCVGSDFSAQRQGDGWTFQGQRTVLHDLPLPTMAGGHQLRNAAAALTALESVHSRLPVDGAAIQQGLRAARVAGRFQQIAVAPAIFVDVAHNPEAARALAAILREQPIAGRTLAVVGMLADKDAAAVFDALRETIDAWWVGTPDSPRACAADALAGVLRAAVGARPITIQPDVRAALAAAKSNAGEGDRIIVFGSFYTVAAVLDHATTQS